MGQLHEQTVLVVGLGSIGRQTAQLLAALGARVVGANRSAVEVPGVERTVRLDALAEGAQDVDAIVVTLPRVRRRRPDWSAPRSSPRPAVGRPSSTSAAAR